jgi:hypothetical protein
VDPVLLEVPVILENQLLLAGPVILESQLLLAGPVILVDLVRLMKDILPTWNHSISR